VLIGLIPYHAKYFAHELTKRCPADSIGNLANTLVDAQIDLNPHQIEAALFAFRSPLSKDALLADEVGLGKTIEAGLLLSQKWAARKRWVLVITPFNLRKQWRQELQEKFFLLLSDYLRRDSLQALPSSHWCPAFRTAGFLRGRRATTHPRAYRELEPYCGSVVEARVVDEGNLVTTGGVSSAIDAGLHVVKKLAGESLLKWTTHIDGTHDFHAI
jgi:transcriptional regulator GlxA family with amidase domain